VAFARQVFMHLARRLTKASLPGIGRYLNRDHSTCHHAVVLVGNRRERDKPFDSLMLKLEAEIKEEMAAWQSNLMPTKSPDASLLTPAL
jgi:chromosomal replication initiation ATPase DnaA